MFEKAFCLSSTNLKRRLDLKLVPSVNSVKNRRDVQQAYNAKFHPIAYKVAF
jgi:hypothetical protein